MKFTVSWLKDHLDTTATPDQIADKLTMIGLEVESMKNQAAGLETFVVAHVEAAEKHPDADKLQVCKVNDGTQIWDVVCGAPNARAGMKGVFAPSGAYIPGSDITLKKAKIRGVESNGMLLSMREMGLGDDHDGIVELPDDATAGSSAVDALGINDVVIEIGITPNRGDCLGVRGIARDLAAAGLGTLKPLNADPIAGVFDSPITVTTNDTDACPYFVGRTVRGVKNGDSPDWLKARLEAIGLRPISALVDITNLMTFEYNRPLHVFDADKVAGNIQVRLAKAGEKILALDGKEYTLDDTMTVVCDDNGPEALGGVMGGEESGCTETTTTVFLEAAIFDPVRTATTGRKLNLQSDARYRFERGLDTTFVEQGIEIATRLILDLCGGEASTLVVGGAEPDATNTLAFRPSRILSLGGADVPRAEVDRILGELGFSVTGTGDDLTVTIPAWRNDIVGEACIVEEVLRIYGYHHIPVVPLARDSYLPAPVRTPDQTRRAMARRTLASRGLTEAVTYSFMPSEQAQLFGDISDDMKLVNPISADLDVMRPSILPNLISACARNADKGIPDAALFEVGPQFVNDTPKGQATVAAGVRTGRTGPRNWARPPRAVDAFDVKADALAALAAAGAPVDNLQVSRDVPGWYHPGRAGALTLGPKTVLATFGEIHPAVAKALGCKSAIAGFEVFLDNLPKKKAKKSAARPHLTLSAFQPVSRDFAFVVDSTVDAAKVVQAARGADKALITDVRVFDVFEGESLGADKKSLAISVTLQPKEQTLTDKEIEAVADKVVAKVQGATGGQLRG